MKTEQALGGVLTLMRSYAEMSSVDNETGEQAILRDETLDKIMALPKRLRTGRVMWVELEPDIRIRVDGEQVDFQHAVDGTWIPVPMLPEARELVEEFAYKFYDHYK